MYRKTMVGCVCVLIAMSGCTRNKTRQSENNALLKPKVPTQNEIAHANYGDPITTEEFENAVVRARLKDPYSAHISCTMPEKGWYGGDLTLGDYVSPIKYGYFSICKVNAKNGFGAYTGEDVAAYEIGVEANGDHYRQKHEYPYIFMESVHIVK